MKIKTMTMAAVLGALMASGCASVQAQKADGKRFTCYPNRAEDRGPFQPATPAGTEMVGRGGASVIGSQVALDGKPYSCVANSAADRGPFRPGVRAGEKLTVR